jgi:hypothetical protein
VVMRKAMHLAGINTKDEGMECLIAASKLTTTVAIGVVTAPAAVKTLGLSHYLILARAALEAYEVGNVCFKPANQPASHVLKVVAPSS